jgi:hypothetical protein
VLSFSFDHSVVFLWSKEEDNTMVKRKRQHCGQKKKTTLWSKEKRQTDKLVGWFMEFNATFNNIPDFSGFVLLNR